MDELNYSELIAKIKQSAKLELEYSKLTLAEKLSILFSRVLIVAVLMIFGAMTLFLLLWATTHWLIGITGSLWLGVLVSLCIIVLAVLLVYGYRKTLIINPVTRFVTKLFLSPEE